MNSDQQKQHATLRRELEQLVTTFEAFEQKQDAQSAKQDAQSREHSADLSRVNRRIIDLQMNLDAAVVEASNTDSAFNAFVSRTFWQRLRWLLTGL